MPFTVLLSFLQYVFLVSYTPGPANIYSFTLSLRYGFKRFLKVYTGLYTGFLIILIVSAFVTYGFSFLSENISKLLKVVGSGYILWLAYHLYISEPLYVETTNKEQLNKKQADRSCKYPNFLNGLLLNLTNVKIMFFALSVFQIYLTPYYTGLYSYLLWCPLLALMGSSSTVVWALLGKGLTNTYNKHYKVFNIVMSFLLVLCVVGIFI